MGAFDDFDEFDDEDFDEFEAELEEEFGDEDDFGSEFDDDLDSEFGMDADDAIDRHNTTVNNKIAALKSKRASVAVRVEAAKWLGTSGEPRTITTLLRAYKTDKDKKVQNAAKAALGQFRALQVAMESDDEEDQKEVNELLEGVIFRGERGKSLGIPIGTMWGIQGALLVLFFILIGAALVLGGQPSTADGDDPVLPTEIAQDVPPQTGETATEEVAPVADRTSVLLALSQQHASLQSDAGVLSEQVRAITQGFGQDCSMETFIQAQPYDIPPEFDTTGNEDVVSASEQLNAIQTDFFAIDADLQQSCNTQISLSTDQALSHLEKITQAGPILAELPGLWAGVDFSTVPTEVPIPTDTPAPTETPTPIPTTDPSALLPEIQAMDFIIEEMNASIRGTNSLILQYWTDVQTAGTTAACNDMPPTIPANYTVPQTADLAFAPPQLATAAQQVNLGLELSRQSWALFTQSCQDGSLSSNVSTGLTAAQTAKSAFESATNSLDQLR